MTVGKYICQRLLKATILDTLYVILQTYLHTMQYGVVKRTAVQYFIEQ